MDLRIKGISHITFICRDIEKTAYMLKELFNAKEIYSNSTQSHSISREKFFVLADYWIKLMEGESINKSHNPIAFEVDEFDLPAFHEKIMTLGLTILSDRHPEDEISSLSFYDYDNYLFELHTGI